MAAATYQLKSELARLSLPAPERATSRRMAWANSISFIFLIIGVVGAQSNLPALKAVPPLEQPAPVILEPLPPVVQPAADAKPSEAQNQDDKPAVPSMVAVTLDTPAINFAVPTAGTLLVPMAAAPAPAEMSMSRAAPVVRHEPVTIQNTGSGGDRPGPHSYPEIARQLGIQGTVVLSVSVDDAGKPVALEVHKSSGSPILDDNAESWVKKHWTIPPTNGGKIFLVPFKYELH